MIFQFSIQVREPSVRLPSRRERWLRCIYLMNVDCLRWTDMELIHWPDECAVDPTFCAGGSRLDPPPFAVFFEYE